MIELIARSSAPDGLSLVGMHVPVRIVHSLLFVEYLRPSTLGDRHLGCFLEHSRLIPNDERPIVTNL